MTPTTLVLRDERGNQLWSNRSWRHATGLEQADARGSGWENGIAPEDKSRVLSGWQQAIFSNPVAITANTVYVASYHTAVGHYSIDKNYFIGNGITSGPLNAVGTTASGSNG